MAGFRPDYLSAMENNVPNQLPVLLPVNGVSPSFGDGTWLAPNCTVVGNVTTGKDCSIWFGSVVRGDVCAIRIGDTVNVQDGAVLHGTFEKTSLIIGDRASIGHNAIVHGCTIEDNVLIGMGAIVMDDCVVGEGCIVAAGSVVTQGKKLAPGTLWAGVPAKEIGPVPERLRKGEIERIANNYLKYSSWYKDDE